MLYESRNYSELDGSCHPIPIRRLYLFYILCNVIWFLTMYKYVLELKGRGTGKENYIILTADEVDVLRTVLKDTVRYCCYGEDCDVLLERVIGILKFFRYENINS